MHRLLPSSFGMADNNLLEIYTDGCSLQSPRRGGIGVRYVSIDSSGDEFIQDIYSPGYINATNNQMELQACIIALKEAIRLQLTYGITTIVIYTDSLYVVDNYKKAMFEWHKSKWLLRSGKPVLNADRWKELIKYFRKFGGRIEIKWIRGHSKNIHNRAVDRMARKSANIAINSPLSIVEVRKKYSSKSVDIGSVGMFGQRIQIRIITSEYLKVQKLYKYKYEVISKTNKYYGNVDIIFSSIRLEVGHSYFIVVNSDTSNPRIAKVFNEIIRK